jgi:error-prone DNA polymerase
MLLEDEFGTINLIVPVTVHDRCRLAVRAEPLIGAEGRLERRDGTTNVVVDRVERLERPDMPRAEVRHIEPRRIWSNDERGRFPGEEKGDTADLRAVAPTPHSFGRRGR